ncbi:MAG: hypothetical protein HKP58_05715, partial [Desulfatitalea sp.]|nr:hypothetical protein [Desulfatitalea sp.]NNJ99892.1 hypothetical protein [Desulfatitalea sp.]
MGKMFFSSARFGLGMILITLVGATVVFSGGNVPLVPQIGPDQSAVPGAESGPVPLRLDNGYPYRGLMLSAINSAQPIHHNNIYMRINGGPLLYQATVPARRTGYLEDYTNILIHMFTRDDTEYTLYLTAAWIDNNESNLSLPFSLPILYPSAGCTEQTVPVASIVGKDQVVEVGSLVTLDGSTSFDPHSPDTALLNYRWVCRYGPEWVTLSNDGKAAVVTFIPMVAGNYYFSFSVLDDFEGSPLNRSRLSHVRVKAVMNLADPNVVVANPGRTQQVPLGGLVTLDGSNSSGPGALIYSWVHQNPLGTQDLSNMGQVFGVHGCQDECFKANYDGDADVDGADLAILAANWGAVALADAPVVSFTASVARPYVFKLYV